MKQFIIFIKKEFIHVFRDRKTLLMLFGLPIAQIILFGFALSNEIKNSKIVILDHAMDVASGELTQKIAASAYFDIDNVILDPLQLEDEFRKGRIKIAVIF